MHADVTIPTQLSANAGAAREEREMAGAPTEAGRAFELRNPRFEDAVRECFQLQGAMAAIDAVLTAVAAGRCSIRLPFSPRVAQQYGLFHGGIISAVADCAGGCAALSVTPPRTKVLTVEYKINFLAPAKGEAIVATGQVLRSGRTLIVCQLQVDLLCGASRTTAAVGQQTIMSMTS
jgi:uncharacterized protein (TIGR00369 family)